MTYTFCNPNGCRDLSLIPLYDSVIDFPIKFGLCTITTINYNTLLKSSYISTLTTLQIPLNSPQRIQLPSVTTISICGDIVSGVHSVLNQAKVAATFPAGVTINNGGTYIEISNSDSSLDGQTFYIRMTYTFCKSSVCRDLSLIPLHDNVIDFPIIFSDVCKNVVLTLNV